MKRTINKKGSKLQIMFEGEVLFLAFKITELNLLKHYNLNLKKVM